MKESVICFKFLLIVLLSLLPTAKVKAAPSGEPVSYTHLTLPTNSLV